MQNNSLHKPSWCFGYCSLALPYYPFYIHFSGPSCAFMALNWSTPETNGPFPMDLRTEAKNHSHPKKSNIELAGQLDPKKGQLMDGTDTIAGRKGKRENQCPDPAHLLLASRPTRTGLSGF